jgi:hypothetical protein
VACEEDVRRQGECWRARERVGTVLCPAEVQYIDGSHQGQDGEPEDGAGEAAKEDRWRVAEEEPVKADGDRDAEQERGKDRVLQVRCNDLQAADRCTQNETSEQRTIQPSSVERCRHCGSLSGAFGQARSSIVKRTWRHATVKAIPRSAVLRNRRGRLRLEHFP